MLDIEPNRTWTGEAREAIKSTMHYLDTNNSNEELIMLALSIILRKLDSPENTRLTPGEEAVRLTMNSRISGL